MLCRLFLMASLRLPICETSFPFLPSNFFFPLTLAGLLFSLEEGDPKAWMTLGGGVSDFSLSFSLSFFVFEAVSLDLSVFVRAALDAGLGLGSFLVAC